MPKNYSKNDEIAASRTPYGGFRNSFTKKSSESNITNIFMGVITHIKLRK